MDTRTDDRTQRPVALVTGAARRIGAAIARRLHADGFDLALHHRGGQADADALLAELNGTRAGSVIALQAELAHFDRLPELVARTVGRFGRLDALVNNASAFHPTPIGSATPAHWDELFASNARAGDHDGRQLGLRPTRARRSSWPRPRRHT